MGKIFPLHEPDIDAIDIEDIAHALSLICRFNGHCQRFCSVAEHSVHVSAVVPPQFALWGLLHDAAEAYLGDVPAPLKKTLSGFKEIEDGLLQTITGLFGLSWPEPPEVKDADRDTLLAERNVLMLPPPLPWPGDEKPAKYDVDPAIIQGWSPKAAKQAFLDRFKELGGFAA